MATQLRGEWVVGLNPDDRMPNDWLRMVARVFASFRKAPLKDSIVVYIDGLNISLVSHINFVARIKIEPGQAFVDDQFIGFIEDSYFEFDTSTLVEGAKYCLVLHYRWLNQFPPPEPSFELHMEQNVNREEMLCLGYITCTRDPNTGICSLQIIDEKEPWYKEWIGEAVGNPEIDNESQLPYIVAIKSGNTPEEGGSEFPDDPAHPEKEVGSIDIGWAIDFHHTVGNNVNYNTRLHTDGQTDGVLYVNGRRVISEINPSSSTPDDPMDATDKYIRMGNNIIVFDELDGLYPLDNQGSDSGKATLTLAASRKNTAPLQVEGFGAGSVYFDLDTMSTSISNRNDFYDPTSIINELTLTEVADVVTINGNPIWHEGNMISTGQNVMFVGYFNGYPTERPNGDPLEDGDTYYDTGIHAYFYYQVDNWVQVGRSDSMKQYEFEGIEGQQTITCEYNPEFIWVGVSGVQLSKKDYIATDGQTIYFNTPLRAGETVTVFTVLSGEAFGIRLAQLSDVQLINLEEGETVVWDTVLRKWKNKKVSVNLLDDIGNVDTSNRADGHVLQWNSASNMWLAQSVQDIQLSGLRDVSITNPAPGETLVNDGQFWVNQNIMPAGAIITWASPIPPTGFLECDGSTISRTAYAELFNNIGETFGGGDGSTTFRIPDLRGLFVRGWSNGATVDNGRLFGTLQGDAIRNITGEIGYEPDSNYNALFVQDNVPSTGAFNTVEGEYTSQVANGTYTSPVTGKLEFDASRTVPTADENRPINMALMYCIKY